MVESPVELTWFGPFRYGLEELEAGGDAPGWATSKDLASLRTQPGIYLFCVDHPIHGHQALAYIGKTHAIGERLAAHDNWLRKEWAVSVYAAACPKRIDAVERLLIYAHAPIYNSEFVAEPPAQDRDLRVRNIGRFWRLHPDVIADHPWHT